MNLTELIIWQDKLKPRQKKEGTKIKGKGVQYWYKVDFRRSSFIFYFDLDL